MLRNCHKNCNSCRSDGHFGERIFELRHRDVRRLFRRNQFGFHRAVCVLPDEQSPCHQHERSKEIDDDRELGIPTLRRAKFGQTLERDEIDWLRSVP